MASLNLSMQIFMQFRALQKDQRWVMRFWGVMPDPVTDVIL